MKNVGSYDVYELDMERFMNKTDDEDDDEDVFAEIVDEELLNIMFFYDKNGTHFKVIEDNIRKFKMLKEEPYQVLTISFLTFHRGYLNEILEKFILESHQHRILKYLHSQVYCFNNIKEQLRSEPLVLSIYMLSAGFYVWLGSVGIACIVFIGELVKYQLDQNT